MSAILLFCFPRNAIPQEIAKVGEFTGSGWVDAIQPGEITIRNAEGRRKSFLIQDSDERFVSLDGDSYIVSLPCEILVRGKLAGELLEAGMKVKFTGEVNRAGRTGKPVKDMEVLADARIPLRMAPEKEPDGKSMVPCEFVGIIQRISNRKLYLIVPKSNLAPQERISVEVDKDALFHIESNDLNRVQVGDKVVRFKGQRMSNGRMVIRKIDIEMTAERSIATPTFSDQLFLKYNKLSDAPLPPRKESSSHFELYTDLSPRSAKVLLEKLETMYGFLARYYRKRPQAPIECVVVNEPENFRGKIPALAMRKIMEHTGVTISQPVRISQRRRGSRSSTRSVVYSCDDHSVVQHEAVHAYCSMTFGSAGPTWYAEGMAEMGQYFVPGLSAIQIEPVVIEYLTNAPAKEIFDIVAGGKISGDSWKEYSWRWALCYLMARHPRYSNRFQDLGINLMMRKQDSFDSAFANEIDKIEFEYDQFTSNFDNGYRVDLCVWQWNNEPQRVDRNQNFSVLARYGWQSTGLTVEQGQSYDFICPPRKTDSGDQLPQIWSIDGRKPGVGPDGNTRGEGKLVGAILSEYQLSAEFEIGSKRFNFKPNQSGQLYVRCREKWNAIGDNDGQIEVVVRKSPRS